MNSDMSNERRLTRVEVQLETQKETLIKLTEATSQLTAAVTTSMSMKEDLNRLHKRIDDATIVVDHLKQRITQTEGIVEPLRGIDDTVKKNDLMYKGIIGVVVIIFGGFVTTLFSMWQGYLNITPGGP